MNTHTNKELKPSSEGEIRNLYIKPSLEEEIRNYYMSNVHIGIGYRSQTSFFVRFITLIIVITFWISAVPYVADFSKYLVCKLRVSLEEINQPSKQKSQ